MKIGISDLDFLAPIPALPRWGREIMDVFSRYGTGMYLNKMMIKN